MLSHPRLLTFKRHAGKIAMIAGGMLFVLGIIMFFLSKRPSRFALAPGEWLYYRVHMESIELVEGGGDRSPNAEDRNILLVGTGEENQALFAVDAPGQASVHLVSIGSNGQVRTCDGEGRRGEAGIAVGWFDFSLCVLPPGSDEAWDETDLIYAALPAQRRTVQGKVRRTRSGTSPEFQIKLQPSIEWLNSRGQFEQLRDVVCTYRFANGRQALDRAELKLTAAEETPTGRQRLRWRYDITLVSRGNTEERISLMRELAVTGHALSEAQLENRRDKIQPLLSRLDRIPLTDRRLQDLTQRLVDQVRNPARNAVKAERVVRSTTASTSPLPQRWEISVATFRKNQEAEAKKLKQRLAQKKCTSTIRNTATGYVVVVGPYEQQEATVLSALATMFPQQHLAWVEVKP